MNHHSQIGQDLFVLDVLNHKKEGLFLDIGCGEPIKINNTYLLENKHGWKGINIDFNQEYSKLWEDSGRKNKYTLHDALTVDYDILIQEFLKENKAERIDYLSMDLEPPEITFEVLTKFPLDKHRFSVITYEHDFYRGKKDLLMKSRNIFQKHGYMLIVSNINNQEDWWIDSSLV